MKRFIIFIVVGILIFMLFSGRNEYFSNSSQNIELNIADLTNIKKSVDQVANQHFIEAKKRLGENNIKLLIDTFHKTNKSDESDKKALFIKDIFVQNIFSDDKLQLSENFKQSLYLELFEAHVLDRNLEIIPVRLIAIEKITTDDNINKIREQLFPHLKKINKIFILYLSIYSSYLLLLIDLIVR